MQLAVNPGQREIQTAFFERLAGGLQRAAVKTASSWAQRYRILNAGPYRFDKYPWARAMHDSVAPVNAGQKSAQMGFTEVALNLCFYNMDMFAKDCLYVLPAGTPDASDFSTSRFDPAIDASPHLSKIFDNTKNVGLKRAGLTNLYIRGSRSRNQLKSLPVSILIQDEIDEHTPELISLAESRLFGETDPINWKISTPTIPKRGVNKVYLTSTQEHFHFICPGCSKFIELTFPDNIIEPGILICHKCKKVLSHADKINFLAEGQWIPEVDSEIRGFYINQLYSTTITPKQFWTAYEKSLRDPTEEQELYNSRLGIPHVVKGAQILETEFNNCIGSYKSVTKNPCNSRLITMGVDVGTYLHYEVTEWVTDNAVDLNADSTARVLKADKCKDFEELDELMHSFNINFCVIDCNPERRKALEFSERFYGFVRLCNYGNSVSGRTLNASSIEAGVNVDRTSWLDLALTRFRNQTISLPIDISEEYREHIQSPVRIYERDQNNNITARWVNTSPDHFAHARNYSEIALQFAASLTKSQPAVNIY